MNINATLFGQMITFVVFIWFTVKFVWPPLMKALEDRRAKIAEGLAAAERGEHELEVARHKAREIIDEAKAQANVIVEQAGHRALQVSTDAKVEAKRLVQRMRKSAQDEIEHEVDLVKKKLQGQVADIVVAGAEKLIERNIDKAANEDLLNEFVAQLGG